VEEFLIHRFTAGFAVWFGWFVNSDWSATSRRCMSACMMESTIDDGLPRLCSAKPVIGLLALEDCVDVLGDLGEARDDCRYNGAFVTECGCVRFTKMSWRTASVCYQRLNVHWMGVVGLFKKFDEKEVIG
jgi:hypothetical protein